MSSETTPAKLNKTVKKLWLEALESGEYEKGQRALLGHRDGEDHFCCLGVLCDLYARTHPKTGAGFDVWPGEMRPGVDSYFYSSGSVKYGTPALPPRVVSKWANLSDLAMDALIKLNDSQKTWRGVIRYIREKL